MLHQMGFRQRLRELPGAPIDAWEIHLERTRTVHVGADGRASLCRKRAGPKLSRGGSSS